MQQFFDAIGSFGRTVWAAAVAVLMQVAVLDITCRDALRGWRRARRLRTVRSRRRLRP